MEYITHKTDYKELVEAIEQLPTLHEKLQYYNDNYRILTLTNNDLPNPKANIILQNDYKVYCTCKECENKFSITDFEVYRDFVNSQTDKIVKYFDATNDYKAKLEYYFKVNAKSPTSSKLVLKYVPERKEHLKDYNSLKEVIIDVTPQDEIEFNILLELKKSTILNSENNEKQQRTPIIKGTEWYNPSSFIFENRVEEVANYLELIVDNYERIALIKRNLDSINVEKIDVEKFKHKRPFIHEFVNYQILLIVNKIIQKIDFNRVVNISDFLFEVEYYLLALETIKFKKYLNNLLIAKPQQTEIINNQINPHQITFDANVEPQQSIKMKSNLGIKGIALLYWFNEIQITRENANKIASQYNYNAKTSGEGLYQDYLFYSIRTNRLASGETKIRLKNKIKLFDNVINLLSNANAKAKAETDLKTLKSRLQPFEK